MRCEVWEGFIFINFDDTAEPLADYLGTMAKGLEGYPFDEMTEVYSYKAEINSNWKLFIDAFAEFYHAPVLHVNQATREEAEKLQGYGFEALHYALHGPHSVVSSWGGMSPPKDLNMVKPIERKLHSGLFGPWDRPDIEGLDPLPPGVNPGNAKQWGVDSYVFFPNFMLLIWEPGSFAMWHDVYFGTEPEPPLIGRQMWNMYFHPTPLEPGVTYYWRVDEVAADGVTIYEGDLWSFTTVPVKACAPVPADAAQFQNVDVDLAWTAGHKAVSHDVYFGASRNDVANGDASVFLHQLAEKLAEGRVLLRQGDEETELHVPDNVILEVQVEDEDKKAKGVQHSLEVEIKWFDTDQGGPVELG